MLSDAVIVDVFYPFPTALREQALAAGFGDLRHGDDIYGGVSESNHDLDALIAKAVGFPIKKRMAFFRLQKLGDTTTGYIHADDGESEFAGVLHLTAPAFCQGGTAFWKHNESGAEWYGPKFPVPLDQIRADGKDQSKWTMTRLVPMLFNRFVTYPSRVFHSRYPQPAWGTTAAEGRLIWGIFYDRA